MALNATQRKSLCDLLLSLFNDDEFRMLLRFDDRLAALYDSLPGSGVSFKQLVFQAVDGMESAGLIDQTLFELIQRERPFRKDIQEVARLVLVAVPETRAEVKTETEVKTEAKAEVKAEVETEVKTESEPPTKIKKNRKAKILFLDANPKDTGRLRLGEETRTIRDRLAKAKYGKRFTLIETHAARVEDIVSQLADIEPDIVHFSGHSSGTDGLMFEGADGSIALVQGADLSRVLGVLKSESGKPALVVLNSCYSAEQSTAVRDTVGCVVGMTNRIADVAAITFAGTFYEMLAKGKDVRAAHAWAQGAIGLVKNRDTDVAALFAAEGVDPGTLTFVP